ncbi:MAG: hypothetical protein IJ593_07485 [Lachnospiraceae bacterium]|nr:hypothetical protein [Lachnospiraceae bacterium]
MLYIVYLPKKEKENIKDRKVNKMLEIYGKLTNYQNSIIASPGYMSKTDAKISNYLQCLSNIVTNGRIHYGIFNGMNGHHSCQRLGISILDKHKLEMTNYNFIDISINAKVTNDHRKVMCFFTFNKKRYKEINIKNYKTFLNDITVNAVLIGSSNQSDTTYFNQIADKGEADIFMFSDKWFDSQGAKQSIAVEDVISNGETEEIVITRSWSGKAHTMTNEFLKSILKDLLETNLNN